MADLTTISEAGLKLQLETMARRFTRAVEQGNAAVAREIHAKATEVMGELLRRMEARPHA